MAEDMNNNSGASSSSKQNKSNAIASVLAKIITAVLVIAVVIGVVVYCCCSIYGSMYVEFDGNYYYISTSGISLKTSEDPYVFTIGNYYSWGLYSVTGCTVKVIGNVSDDSSYNFSYTVEDSDGNSEDHFFSEIGDFTSIFAEDGESIQVDEDGLFKIVISYADTASILQQLYSDCSVTVNDAVSLSSAPYFAIDVVSPDGGSEIVIPFTIVFDASIKLSDDHIIF